MGFGLAMILVATARFVRTSKLIERPAEHSHYGSMFDIVMAALLCLIGLALLVYLSLNLAGA
jgi:hypothetical protein